MRRSWVRLGLIATMALGSLAGAATFAPATSQAEAVIVVWPVPGPPGPKGATGVTGATGRDWR
jgi:hypothetical protein